MASSAVGHPAKPAALLHTSSCLYYCCHINISLRQGSPEAVQPSWGAPARWQCRHMLHCGHWAFISTGFYPPSRPVHSAHVCSASLCHKPSTVCFLPARAHWHGRGEQWSPLRPHCRPPSGRKTSHGGCMVSLGHGHSPTVNAFRGTGRWRRQEAPCNRRQRIAAAVSVLHRFPQVVYLLKNKEKLTDWDLGTR